MSLLHEIDHALNFNVLQLAAHSLNPFCVFAARLLQRFCGCKSKARGRGRLNLRPEKPRRHSHALAMRMHLRLYFFQKQKVYKGVLPFTYGQLFALFSNHTLTNQTISKI